MALGPQDRLCIPVPLYHCFGMVLGVLCATASGAAMVFPGESFDAADTLRSIAKHRCTALHGVPTMFTAMLEEPTFAQHDVSACAPASWPARPCPIETMRKGDRADAPARDHDRLRHDRDLADLVPVGLDDPIERRVSTVGRIQPHLEVKSSTPTAASCRSAKPASSARAATR
jgi:fatty-acyl-CoA synthase